MSERTPTPRDRMGRYIDEKFIKIGAVPPSPPHPGPPLAVIRAEAEKRRLRALADRNARLEKTQECWEKCNCKKK